MGSVEFQKFILRRYGRTLFYLKSADCIWQEFKLVFAWILENLELNDREIIIIRYEAIFYHFLKHENKGARHLLVDLNFLLDNIQPWIKISPNFALKMVGPNLK